MQLATSQRAHPPPVPPRPSRQVVAEALKRSPRPPPCPTRQAPPPPNTRPWRSEVTENANFPKPGRTVVYESGREPHANGEKSADQSSRGSVGAHRCAGDETVAPSCSSFIASAVVEKTVERGVGGPSGGTSERNEAENQRERQRNQQPQQQQPRQRPQPRSNGSERCDRENSAAHPGEPDSDIAVSGDKGSPISYDDSLTNERSVSVAGRTKNDLERGSGEEEGRQGVERASPVGTKTLLVEEHSRISGSVDEGLWNFGRASKTPLDGCANGTFAGSSSVERAAEIRYDDAAAETRRSSSFGNKSNRERDEATGGVRLSTTPTRIEKISNGGKVVGARDENEETISRGREDEAEATMSGSTTTISSDDCATVVVIDEPERKIAFSEDNDNIHHQDWLEAGVRYSSTKITLPGDDPVDHAERLDDDDDDDDDVRRAYAELDFSSIRERIAMSSLQGLPPLPRSLSGFNLSEGRREAGEPPPPPARSSSKTPKNVKSTQPSSSRPSPPGRQLTTLDTQLAILRKEMFGLRQLDLSLLSQLWSLNESIQEFRQLLQEQEDRAPSPSPSSEEGDDNSYGSHPPPPPRRPAPLLHHHRPPRPPRPLRPPASDDSPSSEEYGAV